MVERSSTASTIAGSKSILFSRRGYDRPTKDSSDSTWRTGPAWVSWNTMAILGFEPALRGGIGHGSPLIPSRMLATGTALEWARLSGTLAQLIGVDPAPPRKLHAIINHEEVALAPGPAAAC
jgi:hypothetical protein